MNCQRCLTAIAMPGEPLCGACDEALEEAGPPPRRPQAPRRAPKVTNAERRELIRKAAMSAVEHSRWRRQLQLRYQCAATGRQLRPCRNLAKFDGLCRYHFERAS